MCAPPVRPPVQPRALRDPKAVSSHLLAAPSPEMSWTRRRALMTGYLRDATEGRTHLIPLSTLADVASMLSNKPSNTLPAESVTT